GIQGVSFDGEIALIRGPGSGTKMNLKTGAVRSDPGLGSEPIELYPRVSNWEPYTPIERLQFDSNSRASIINLPPQSTNMHRRFSKPFLSVVELAAPDRVKVM